MEMFAKLYFCPFNSQFKIEQIQMYQIIFDYNGDFMNWRRGVSIRKSRNTWWKMTLYAVL